MKTILYASLSFFLVLTTTRTAQAQAGTIAPNAVTIPMDQRGTLSEFVDGVAIIRRGDAVGLINHRGEMVVPYNQYKSILPLTDGYSYVQNETYKYGVVDGTGKQVVPCEYNEPKSMTGIGPYLGAGYIFLCTKHDSPGEIRDLRTGKIAPAPSKKQILFALGDGMAPLDYPHYPARQTGIGLVPARERVDKYQQRTVPIGFVDFSGK